MAEATLSPTLDDINDALAVFLGWGLGTLNSNQNEVLGMLRKTGLRTAYWPENGHEWSFLKPFDTITTQVPYSTGTVEVVNGDATVTLTGGTWPNWAASGVIRIGGSHLYSVATRTDDDEIELDHVWQGESDDELTYQISQHTYDLPDDFGHLIGPLSFQPGYGTPSIRVVPASEIYGSWQQAYSTGKPCRAATQPNRIANSASEGQRWQLLLDPGPDASYVLNYQYAILPDALVSSTRIYHYGGSWFGGVIMEACLAAAERYLRTEDVHTREFQRRVAAAVAYDQRTGGDYLGYNDDRSDDRYESVRPSMASTLVTYNGVLYD